MDTHHRPLVSIGLPTYNGARYVADAVESALSQSFGDFELIVSDNASSDDTHAIVQELAARDPRIRSRRNDHNIGGSRNHNLTVQLSRGRYFMWAACDDVRAPTFLERCTEVLERNSDLVACYTKTRYIGPEGTLLPDEDNELPFDDPDVRVRFRAAIGLTHRVAPLLGLIRSDVLRDTRLFGHYSDSDRPLLAELALRGRLHRVPEFLLFRRLHDASSTRLYPTRHARMRWFEPALPPHCVVFPYFREAAELLRAVHYAPLRPRDRRHCYVEMAHWSWRYRRRLWWDCKIALKTLLRLGHEPLWRAAGQRWMYRLTRTVKKVLVLRGWRGAKKQGASAS